jgi:hypothetical protein
VKALSAAVDDVLGSRLNQVHATEASDGSLRGLTATIENGVAPPKQYQGVMPPLGGAPLSPRDVASVAAYAWAIGHAGKP